MKYFSQHKNVLSVKIGNPLHLNLFGQKQNIAIEIYYFVQTQIFGKCSAHGYSVVSSQLAHKLWSVEIHLANFIKKQCSLHIRQSKYTLQYLKPPSRANVVWWLKHKLRCPHRIIKVQSFKFCSQSTSQLPANVHPGMG